MEGRELQFINLSYIWPYKNWKDVEMQGGETGFMSLNFNLLYSPFTKSKQKFY